MKYRKKPVVIEAVQWKGDNFEEVSDFLKSEDKELQVIFDENGIKAVIKTLNGEVLANPEDMIIKGVKGEFYPCDPTIFKQTYEKVEADNELSTT